MTMTSEAIERAALLDLHAAASESIRAALDLRVYEIGESLISAAGALPASAIVINRALGFAPEQFEDAGFLSLITSVYRGAGVERFFLQIAPEAHSETLCKQLIEQRLEKARGWQKFRRRAGPIAPPVTDFRVEEIGPQHGPAFARIVCAAFDLGEIAEPWLARLPGRENWHIFMSFDGDEPAGTGALFVRDGEAWTDWGATAPACRGRGSQGLLLAVRLMKARELGCKWVRTCTGEAVLGDPQHSWNNIIRHGFTEDYVRANYAPLQH